MVISATPNITVLVAEALPLVRSALRALIERESGLSVVGEVGAGTELASLVARARPDVLVLSSGLPGRPLARLMADVIAACPDVAIMALAGPSDEQAAVELLRSGAAGCVLKSDLAEELLYGIRAVARGDTWVSSSIARSLLRQQMSPPQPSPHALTEREQEILDLLTSGLSNKEISQKLYLSVRTIEVHLRNVYSKLGVRSRLEAVTHTTRFSSSGRHPQG